MAELNKQITLPDGRVLGYARFGACNGRPLLYFHGFPATRLEARILDADATRLGVSVIAPDRPGFGLSDFQPGREILDWPEDVRHLADQLGLERFSVMGVSGGGPFALACAYRLPERIVHTGIVAGLGPTSKGTATRQMSVAARLGFFLARRAPGVFNFVYGALSRLIARFPDLIFHLNKVTGPDREVLARPEIRRTLTESTQEALRRGPEGPLHELKLLSGPWGFAPDEISANLIIWHGLKDGTVPHEMSQSVARGLAHAELNLLPDEGHVSISVRHGAEMLSALCPG